MDPSSPVEESPVEDTTNLADEERGFRRGASDAGSQSVPLSVVSGNDENGTYIKRKTSQLLEAFGANHLVDPPLSQELRQLVQAYADSEVAAGVKREIETAASSQDTNGEMRDVAVETTLLKGRKRAIWTTQFRILSGRAFKNLYRDPSLLLAHYAASIGLAREFFAAIRWTLGCGADGSHAVICGLFFHNVAYVTLVLKPLSLVLTIALVTTLVASKTV